MAPHLGADGLVQGELPPISLNFVRFHQPCLSPWHVPFVELKATGQGLVRTVVTVPRADHLPGSAGCLPSCRVFLEVLTTPTRRYHGRTLIRPSLLAPPLGSQKVIARFAGSGPSRGRRRPSKTRLEHHIAVAISVTLCFWTPR